MKKILFFFLFLFLSFVSVKAENIDNVTIECKSLGSACIRVTNTDEIIKAIDDIYTIKEANEYHLLYTDEEYDNIDFDEVMKYYKDKYLVDSNKNIYKYAEYAYFQPIRSLPYYDESELIIYAYTIKTSYEEEEKVDEFLKVLLPYLENLSTYEKILGVYSYINDTTSYIKDDGYINFQEADLSAYDVLFKHKAVCISGATTFQLLMEKLGIESYIVDHVVSNNEDNYISTHTYNVVKLDGIWYIVDIKFDKQLSGFLIGKGKYDKNDFKYLDLDISTRSYFEIVPDANKNFDFDYETLNANIKKIDENKEVNVDKIENREEEDNKSNNSKKSYLKEYIIIVTILLIIFFIIWIFTRKARY